MLDYDLMDTVENAAVGLRNLLEYNSKTESDFEKIDFKNLIKRVQDHTPITVEVYDYPVRPMATRFSSRDLPNKSFKIVCSTSIGDGVICLLHEVGHIVLHPNELPASLFDPNELKEEAADVFVRAFLMPKEKFLEKKMQNTNSDGMVNIRRIAAFFNVDDYLVAKRGIDLRLWD